ncbi:endonuclease I [Propionispora hippei]|uniref:Phage endonuclease I n=1 Tax=Propionispora hippei DSM 15287 TaxID=1123003 RepID=A0A1M6MF23_9FIRM|nr:endonuclease I [Propionispora hippei]SHJ81953.1 Phage endonuclease I [Propionispora hippei DSM 15287]
MATKRTFSRRGGWSEHVTSTYRSGLEEGIAGQLENAGVPVAFEKYYLEYTIPASVHKYTPDFLLPNGIIVESKGLFESEDRKKHLLVKAQYPHLDIRFIFSNPNQKLYKGSPTTYAMWCEKYGFLYAKKLIPLAWLKEKPKDTTGLQTKKGGKS